MAENEGFAYQMSDQSTVDYSLITQERSAKLELLSHLLSNSTRAIILCGSKGIGKTTLLNVFQQRRNASWHTCFIQSRADLTLERIETQLMEIIPKTQTLVSFFEQLAAQHKKIVLIIDDAGSLAPYLITLIINYVSLHSVLNVVFVLTHDDLAIKTHSDSAIEDCHIIEIPPLSEAQCGDFLHHLALKSTFKIPIDSITDSMIASLYQQTHGIPANIIAQLPRLVRPQKNTKTAEWLPITLLGLLVAWIVLWVLSGHNMPSLAPLHSLLKSLTDR
ncbi:MAG: ATP-binding protein [Methylococcaceae bacterium]|nr:ATP-binding protein [Methylococcaceae bacterium]